jgi:hypothetical protein
MDYRKFFSDIINTQTVDYTPFDESVKSNIYFQAVLEKIIALPNSYFYISLDPVLFSISHVSNNAVDADTVSPDTFTHIATIIEDEEETFWKKNHLEDAPEEDAEGEDEENEEDEENDDDDEDAGEDGNEEDEDPEGEDDVEGEDEGNEGDAEEGNEDENHNCPCCGYNPTIEKDDVVSDT